MTLFTYEYGNIICLVIFAVLVAFIFMVKLKYLSKTYITFGIWFFPIGSNFAYNTMYRDCVFDIRNPHPVLWVLHMLFACALSIILAAAISVVYFGQCRIFFAAMLLISVFVYFFRKRTLYLRDQYLILQKLRG